MSPTGASHAGRCSMVGTFAASTIVMALKPMLLHLTRSSGDGGEGADEPLAPELLQLVVEGLKVFICVVALGWHRLAGIDSPVWRGVAHSRAFAWPALVYLVMNWTTVYTARLLRPPAFQLLANVKIVFTAAVSWLLLGRQLSRAQWFALLLLTLGVSVGQLRGVGDLEAPPLMGSLLMVHNSGLSAFGGVLVERALKSPGSMGLSTFATNLHLALYSLVVNGAVVWTKHVLTTRDDRLVQPGWPGLTTVVAAMNEACNGILISMLLRRADSIVKNYAFSASTFATAALSALVLSYYPTPQFFVGAALTLASMVLYSRGGASAPTPTGKEKKG